MAAVGTQSGATQSFSFHFLSAKKEKNNLTASLKASEEKNDNKCSNGWQLLNLKTQDGGFNLEPHQPAQSIKTPPRSIWIQVHRRKGHKVNLQTKQIFKEGQCPCLRRGVISLLLRDHQQAY